MPINYLTNTRSSSSPDKLTLSSDDPSGYASSISYNSGYVPTGSYGSGLDPMQISLQSSDITGGLNFDRALSLSQFLWQQQMDAQKLADQEAADAFQRQSYADQQAYQSEKDYANWFNSLQQQQYNTSKASLANMNKGIFYPAVMPSPTPIPSFGASTAPSVTTTSPLYTAYSRMTL